MATIRNINDRWGGPVEFSGATVAEAVREMKQDIIDCGCGYAADEIREGVDYEVVDDDGNEEAVPPTLEICTNNEALRTLCGVDFHDDDDAEGAIVDADVFCNAVWDRLEEAGFVVKRPSGNRSSLAGWAGAQYAWKCGPVGTFEPLTDKQKETITDIYAKAFEELTP